MKVFFALALLSLLATGCRDLQRFSTAGDHFEGTVVLGSFVRAGVSEDVRLCLSLDMDRVQDAPGFVSSTDGRFRSAPLRPIPQLWHDPLSTLSFGEGRLKNLVYVATPDADAADREDVMVIVSLMQSNGVEVRLVRGAPVPDAGPEPAQNQAIFAVFALDRRPGPCSF